MLLRGLASSRAGVTKAAHPVVRSPFLTGESIYLRGPVAADAEQAVTWFPSTMPTGATRATSYLKETLTTAWYPGDKSILLIANSQTDAILGSVSFERPKGPDARIKLAFAPHISLENQDKTFARVLELVVPWLRDEIEVRTATFFLGADQTTALAAADASGLEQTARLREYVARPGGRVDLIICQLLNRTRVHVSETGTQDQA